MWSRAELKLKGKLAFRRNYWAAVLVAFVMVLITGTASGSAGNAGSNVGRENTHQETYSEIYGTDDFDDYGTFPGDSGVISGGLTVAGVVTTAILGIIGVLLLVFKILIGNALLVGGYRFFIMNQTEPTRAGTLGYVFKSGNFGNVILTMFLKDLYTALWSMLFVIPGIIKSYEYLMVPYILAENPGMNRKEAFLISKKMMMGQKWNAFVLDLSFFGWRLLEGLTLGLVGIFYVEPYYQATIAEMYSFNRELAYREGYIR